VFEDRDHPLNMKLNITKLPEYQNVHHKIEMIYNQSLYQNNTTLIGKAK